jgi:hypothetical protein
VIDFRAPVLIGALFAAPSAPVPTRDYLVFVASESADRVALVRFGPAGIKIERPALRGIEAE